ncbi:MAG: phosphomethylpyrimidine synthase ThiC [Candidatus Thermoplasmatota archaeon]|nr:phosphomethylpyrimidine synthase ThiC [Candidatus Thermoplasmatota archaeon]
MAKESVERLRRQKRLIPMVSRGGAFHMAWMLHNEQENPLYKHFDYLLEIAKKYREKRLPMEDENACSMCGNLCAIELVKKYLEKQ